MKAVLNPEDPCDDVVAKTKCWIETVVIGLNFCPFAAKPFKSDQIGYFVEGTLETEEILDKLLGIIETLDKNQYETAFLILKQTPSFDVYLDFLQLTENLIKLEGLQGIYQIASFHPDYCFGGSAVNDAANYTNRSPFAMFHVLKEESLTAAIEKYPDSDEIPHRNIKRARDLGQAKMQQFLIAAKESH